MPTLAERCSHPVRFSVQSLDTRTGTLSASREVLKACGSRQESKCPSCAAIYRGDCFALIRSGLANEDGDQEPLTFFTLTAPGAEVFGKVHSRRIKRKRNGKRYHYGCACGRYHKEGDPILGQPLNRGAYKYQEASDWNAASARLFSITMQKLARQVFGVDEKGKPLGKLDYIRVAEYQRRGLIHFHVLVRGLIDVRDFHAVVRGGETSSGTHIEKVQHKGFTWGRECHSAEITPGSRFGAGAYLVKLVGYAVKDVSDENGAGGFMGSMMRGASLNTCDCKSDTKCSAKQNRNPSDRSSICRRHRLARNGWGYRGHTLTKSRAWGTTFQAIRDERRHYVGKQSPPTLKAFDQACRDAALNGLTLQTPPRLTVWTRLIDRPALR